MNREYTPLANRTTVSSRNKMAGLATVGPSTLHHISNRTNANNNNNFHHHTVTTTSASSRIPPKTSIKQPMTKTERLTATLAATSSRIAVPRSRLSATSHTSSSPSNATNPSRIASTIPNGSHKRLDPCSSSQGVKDRGNSVSRLVGASTFANSRSSSKVSSLSSATNNTLSRQSSMTNAQASRKLKIPSAIASNYIPDTNSIRKGLAKFSNPIECQRQFQALNSDIRHLKDTNTDKDRQISRLQEQLKSTLNHGIGYATVVQYFSRKLKIESDVNLEEECEQLKQRVENLLSNEKEYEDKLESIVSDYKSHLEVELDLRAKLQSEFEGAKEDHSSEMARLKEAHSNELQICHEVHQTMKEDLDNRIQVLEADLEKRTKELSHIRKEYEILDLKFIKLEESLTKDKDARVKYAQEKVNQLQKDVESLNSVLEMKSERIHALEKDSILLSELQQELSRSQDQNKALKQQLESVNAALENKRVQLERLLVDHEKISQELKRERKERRRMTMRSEQLEFVLNESCASESNLTVIEKSFET